MVDRMSTAEQVGQLVMAPLPAGSPSSTLDSLITQNHVGSVLVTGNWTVGTSGVRQAVDSLQGKAPQQRRLLMATDQEGGTVQHLQGPGFGTMPSAVTQGAMDTTKLREAAAVWGGQLSEAGINVNLAPVVDTVRAERSSNAPIGALDRDYGLDASGNALHAQAFIEGMRDAGVRSTIKHYPGLGAVQGNTDFTTQGIVDTTTTLDGPEIGGFSTALQAEPAMVMMSLATYTAIDPSEPAVFSAALIDGHLRAVSGYRGVVISDSLSAAALTGIQTDQLGVRLVEAGGDLACISALADVGPVIEGLNAKAQTDPNFAAQVKRSAQRVLTLKYDMQLAE